MLDLLRRLVNRDVPDKTVGTRVSHPELVTPEPPPDRRADSVGVRLVLEDGSIADPPPDEDLGERFGYLARNLIGGPAGELPGDRAEG